MWLTEPQKTIEKTLDVCKQNLNATSVLSKQVHLGFFERFLKFAKRILLTVTY